MSNFSELQTQVYYTAVEHGFWETRRPNIAEKIALIHSELSEALEEFRRLKGSNKFTKLTEIYYNPDKPAKPEGFAVELADAVIRIMDLCEYLGIDLEEAIIIKDEYNSTREYKHGKAF